jgi:hypothetical protein
MRDGSCIYRGEGFPYPGEPLDVSGIEVRFLMAREQLPDTWTGLVEVIRGVTHEQAERRVLVNLLGTLLVMVEGKLLSLGVALGVPDAATAAIAALRSGDDSIAVARSALTRDPVAAGYVDFEVIKIASMLVIPAARAAREQAGWPYPDAWGGDPAVLLGPSSGDPAPPGPPALAPVLPIGLLASVRSELEGWVLGSDVDGAALQLDLPDGGPSVVARRVHDASGAQWLQVESAFAPAGERALSSAIQLLGGLSTVLGVADVEGRLLLRSTRRAEATTVEAALGMIDAVAGASSRLQQQLSGAAPS